MKYTAKELWEMAQQEFSAAGMTATENGAGMWAKVTAESIASGRLLYDDMDGALHEELRWFIARDKACMAMAAEK